MSRISEEQRTMVRKVFQETGSLRATAKQTGVSRNAVRRELKRSNSPGQTVKKASFRQGKLTSFKSKIEYLAREKDLSGVRILEEIQELGYKGGYSILKEYLRKVRPRARKRPTAPIDHPPGHEGQMDWSEHKVDIGGRIQKVQTGSIVLCFSRWMFTRIFLDQTIESVIALHEQAFQELGAVPEIMTYDNMTTVGRHVGPGKVWINPIFERFAKEYGFKIVILQPGKKERHGMVERPFHYIENNFLKGREFRDLEDLNQRMDHWRANKANVRIHGTLREKPMARLERERSFLKPLSRNLSNQVYKEVERLVHADFCIAVDCYRYSVDPSLIGEHVQVRLYKEHLEIWLHNQMHCRHVYATGQDQRQILPEHQQRYKSMSGQKHLLEQAFLRLGETARMYYQGLLIEKKGAAGYHMQRILKLADRHGQEVVLGALNHAAKYGAYDAETLLRVIQGKKLRRGQTTVMPDNVRQWLKAQAVQQHDLGRYDKLIQGQEEQDGPDPT
jgi:transposase